MVNKAIAKYPCIYKFMPVPAGFGPSSLDYLLCVRGDFVAVETKVKGKDLTPRQKLCARQIEEAGGKVFKIDGPDTLKPFEDYLEWKCNPSQSA